MKVLLYNVFRNLNRAYRTCEAFGISELFLKDCSGGLSDNLFKAEGRVSIRDIPYWPEKLLLLETCFSKSILKVNWKAVNYIAIGGETSGLPKIPGNHQRAVIPMVGKVSGLTVEAALAIALWEWRRCSGE